MKNKFVLVIALLIALALFVGTVWPAVAQQSSLEPTADATDATPLVEAAIQTVNRSFPGIGPPAVFSYTFLDSTSDSSLGCPLIEGFDLGRFVVPYRIILSYGDRQYTYHASGDGTMLFPCDEQLPIGGPVAPGSVPFSASPAEAAISAALRTFPERGFPNNYTFTFSTPTTDSSLGCPLMEGFDLGRVVIPYRIVLTYADGQFTYHASEDGTILFLCDEQLPIGGPMPPESRPLTPTTPAEAAINAFLRDFPELGFPERYEFMILEIPGDRLLDCPTAEGSAADPRAVPYRVMLFSHGTSFLYYVSADGTTVIACQ
jgi:hypothetical protein